MVLSIDINDKELTEVIEKGIKNLDPEIVADMAKEALRKFLEDPEVMQMLLFDYEKSSYFGQKYFREPQKWFVDLFKDGFSEDEIGEYKASFLKAIEEKRDKFIVETFASLFSKMLVTDEFLYELRGTFSRMNN